MGLIVDHDPVQTVYGPWHCFAGGSAPIRFWCRCYNVTISAWAQSRGVTELPRQFTLNYTGSRWWEWSGSGWRFEWGAALGDPVMRMYIYTPALGDMICSFVPNPLCNWSKILVFDAVPAWWYVIESLTVITTAPNFTGSGFIQAADLAAMTDLPTTRGEPMHYADDAVGVRLADPLRKTQVHIKWKG